MVDSRIKAIFLEALELQSGDREVYLREACASDDELRARVDKLLASEEKAKANDLLGPAQLPVHDPVETEGNDLGRYKLLMRIGEGGFGSVWVAEQREPVRRRVALKIIKLGMDTKQVIARFEAERQALAMMDHPNIARIFDAGATENGRPYFVMEYVQGVSITEYSDDEKLSARERLELFILVCQAIQHAHQKGIIHRDIKPSNILVGMVDGKPVPKVIDFGIAKATNQELTNKTLFTSQQQLMGTPSYMSPEQATFSGIDVDTRSDIYSLGVVLYELLTGVRTIDPEDLSSGDVVDVIRAIREKEPAKPSTRCAMLGDSAMDLAARRCFKSPEELRNALQGELDWIVMKCLEKDRRRRYDTANDLYLDIQRHLDGEAVHAAPPSVAYRVRKFFHRHRGVAVATAAVALVFLLGLAGTTGGLLWALNQRDRALLAEESMHRELVRVREVKRLVTEMIAGINPTEARDADTTLLRNILDRTAKRLTDGEIADELIAAELHDVIGDTYVQLGLFAEAERHLPIAVRLRTTILGDSDEATLESRMHLAILRRLQGRLDEAQEHYEQTLELARETLGGDHWLTLGLNNNLGTLYWQQDRLEDAEPRYREALEGYTRTKGEEDRRSMTAMSNLAMLYRHLKRYDECEALTRETMAIQERVLSADDPQRIPTMVSLGNLYTSQGRLTDAIEIFGNAVELARRVQGPEHPDTLTIMNNLADLYGRVGRFEESEALFIETIEKRGLALTNDHVDTLGTRTALARLYLREDRFEEALEQLEISYPALQSQLSDDHRDMARARAALRDTYRGLQMSEERMALDRGLLERRLARAGEVSATAKDLRRAASTLLGMEFESLRDTERAKQLAERALAQAEVDNDPSLHRYLDLLARAHAELGNIDTAIELERRALDVSSKSDKATIAERLAELEGDKAGE